MPHEGIEVMQAVAHEQRMHVGVGVDHHHKRAPPRLILAPVRSSDGVPAATGAVLALMAAGAMREHYAGATASAIAEPLRRSSSWTTVIVRKAVRAARLVGNFWAVGVCEVAIYAIVPK